MRVDKNKNITSKSYRDNNFYVSNSVKNGKYHNNYTTVISNKSNGVWTSTITNTRELNTRGIITIIALVVSFLLLFSLIDDIYNGGIYFQKFTFTGFLNFLQDFSSNTWHINLDFAHVNTIADEWIGFEFLRNFFNSIITIFNGFLSFITLITNSLLNVLNFAYRFANYIFNANYNPI